MATRLAWLPAKGEVGLALFLVSSAEEAVAKDNQEDQTEEKDDYTPRCCHRNDQCVQKKCAGYGFFNCRGKGGHAH